MPLNHIHTIIFTKNLSSFFLLVTFSPSVSITSTLNLFSLLFDHFFTPRDASVYIIAVCLKNLCGVKCFRFSSEGALRGQGAGIRPLRSLPVRPGESHHLQEWKGAVPHQSEKAQRYDPATFRAQSWVDLVWQYVTSWTEISLVCLSFVIFVLPSAKISCPGM